MQRRRPLAEGTYTLSSGFGARVNPVTGRQEGHRGLDFAAKDGTAIYAAAAGTVELAGPASGFGQWIVIKHPTGERTVYGHMWSATTHVRAGQAVTLGQRIGSVGSNGQSTGPHLHFEVLQPNASIDAATRINPTGWLDKKEADVASLGEADYPPREQMKGMWNDAPNEFQFIGQHTTESDGGNSNVIGYLERNWGTGSYHWMVDFDGERVRLVPDSKQAWAALPIGNRKGLHVCAMGYASWSRERWLQEGKMLESTAQVYAAWSKQYGIPLVKITAAEAKAGKRGVLGHGDIKDAWGEGTHWDPGPNYPYDRVIARAKEILGQVPSQPAPGGGMSPEMIQWLGDPARAKRGWLQLRPFPDNQGKVYNTFLNREMAQDEGLTVVEALCRVLFESTLRIPAYRGDARKALGPETVLGHAAAAAGGVDDILAAIAELTREVQGLKAKIGA
ncbi:lysin A [Rhodococcus phage Apiary]|nr:lysin A [Rhodococcus phage Braxoaddie]WNM64973.1 lysin A [Rhodococcus phage Maselop]WNM67434.1 lysin A [Rhodococcus phage Polyyuki]WNM69858.1 lysin A [Rhodococcus phage Apiary]